MSPKELDLMEWLKINIPYYLEHNDPSPVTKEWMRSMDKTLDEFKVSMKEHNANHEHHMEKIMDKLDETYSKKDIDVKLKGKADSWTQKGIVSIGTIVIGFVVTKLLTLI